MAKGCGGFSQVNKIILGLIVVMDAQFCEYTKSH